MCKESALWVPRFLSINSPGPPIGLSSHYSRSCNHQSTMSSLVLSNAFLSSRSSVCPLQRHHAPSPVSSHRRRSGTISCASSREEKTANNHSDESNGLVMDRRGVLLGLGGGLYGTTANMAVGAPIAPPDFKTCKTATSAGVPPADLQCCPPLDYASLPVRNYPFPQTPLRVRRAAQNVDKAYVDKFNEAVSKMKNLPANDPWNFYQQAKIHCAYCNDGYYQPGTQVNLQVHFNYIFTPWHRYYLHFFERILGKLVGDDTFALPYWNWDAPDGMTFPQIFRDPNSPLYNTNRNPTNIPPNPSTPSAIVDYRQATDGSGSGLTGQELIDANVAQIRSAFRESQNNATLFMGDPVSGGEAVTDADGAGILENIHNAIHGWVGTTTSPNPDMGNFATAARDCIFYCHHSNVDRMWDAYTKLRGQQPEFPISDWLDSTFIFYDEERQLSRVKVRDCLNITNLRYSYEQVPLPWLGKVSRRRKAAAAPTPKAPTSLVTVSEFGPKPRDLDSTIRVLVPRPKTNRSNADKDDELEVLVVTGIQLRSSDTARFDVFISKPYNGNQAGPDLGNYVGSFIKLTHNMIPGRPTRPGRTQGLKLGITYAIEDIGADDSPNLVVTLKPRDGMVTIGGVEIRLLETDTKV